MLRKISLMALAGIIMLTGCDRKGETVEAEAAAEEAAVPRGCIDLGREVTKDAVLSNVKDPAKMTAEEYTCVIRSLSECEITADGSAKEDCGAYEAVTALLKTPYVLDNDARIDVQTNLTSDEIPSVRIQAWRMLEAVKAAPGLDKYKNGSLLTPLAETASAEKDENVLAAALRTLANAGNANADVGRLLVKAAASENISVRVSAANALTSSFNKGLEGSTEAISGLIADSDKNVRIAACRHLGGIDDDALVPAVKNVLNNDAMKDTHNACLEGLAGMWLDYPSFENTSESAYRAMLEFLKKTPRSAEVPGFMAVGAVNNTVRLMKGDKFEAWKTKASYYKASELAAALSDIAKDSNADKMARTNAVKAVSVIGTKGDLEKLKKAVSKAKKDANKDRVLEEINLALDALK